MSSLVEKVMRRVYIKNSLVRECMAECLGTFVLMSFGIGPIAQSQLSQLNNDVGLNNYHSICVAWGVAVAVGVWVAGGVSGGHLNPAVSGAMASIGKLSWVQFIFYSFSQYVGAILASACVYGVYYEALEAACGSDRETSGECATAGIWATYPSNHATWATSLGDQIFCCMLIMICILAITDERNMRPPKGMIPFCIGLIFTMVGLTYGYNCGWPVNPARDLGPRIFTACAGWGTEPFSYDDYNYFWIPVVGPHVGMVIGAWVYQLIIGLHFPKEEDVFIPKPDYLTQKLEMTSNVDGRENLAVSDAKGLNENLSSSSRF